MTEAPKDGGPAFPKPLDPYPNVQNIANARNVTSSGMSLRDWFAGHADLSGVEFPDYDTAAKALGIDPPFDDSVSEQLRFSARLAAALRFMFADAMLSRRGLPQ